MSRNFISFQQRNKAAVRRGAGSKSAPPVEREQLRPDAGNAAYVFPRGDDMFPPDQHGGYHIPSDLHINHPRTKPPLMARKVQKPSFKDLNIMGESVQTPGQEIFGGRFPSTTTDLSVAYKKGGHPAKQAWSAGRSDGTLGGEQVVGPPSGSSPQRRLSKGGSAARLKQGGQPRVASHLRMSDWMQEFACNATSVLLQHHSTVQHDEKEKVMRRIRVSAKAPGANPQTDVLMLSDVIGNTREERVSRNDVHSAARERPAAAMAHRDRQRPETSGPSGRRRTLASFERTGSSGSGAERRSPKGSEGHWDWDPTSMRSSFVRQGGASNGSAVRPQTAKEQEMWERQRKLVRQRSARDVELRLRRPGVEHGGRPPEKEEVVAINAAATMELQERARLSNREWTGGVKVMFDSKQKRVPDEAAIAAGSLQFESHFESGNLRRAIQIGPSEYDLALCPDTNTVRHMQWYYFKVSNVQKGMQYKLNIVNMCKSHSLYSQGLRPLTYSKKRFAQSGTGWCRGCTDIGYYKSSIYYRRHSRIPFRTLTFTYQGEYDDDTVFFAHCYPYTLKHLERDIAQVQADATRKVLMHRRVLCKTPGGNDCLELTITSPPSPSNNPARRPGIFVISRCHPGETPASYILRGIINFLTNPSNPDSKRLRDTYMFKIVPMMNPDGVVCGNTRSTLHGSDLNRCWGEPSSTHSPLDAIKQLMCRFSQERAVALSIDLHAHSRRCNLFSYGCSTRRRGEFADGRPPGFERVFPRILSDRCEAFQYDGCSYNMGASKVGTGRVVTHKEFQVRCSYTIEASFLGGSVGEYEGLHYTSEDYERMGLEMCNAMLDFADEGKVSEYLEALPEVMSLPGEELVESSDEESDSDSDFDSEGDSEDDPLPLSPRTALQDAAVLAEVALEQDVRKQRPSTSKLSRAPSIDAQDGQRRSGAATLVKGKKKISPSKPPLPRPSPSPTVETPDDKTGPRKKKGAKKENDIPEAVLTRATSPGAPQHAEPSAIMADLDTATTSVVVRSPSNPQPELEAGVKSPLPAMMSRAHSTPHSPPRVDPDALRPEEFAVLDRVKDMKKQMAGAKGEFNMLQERIQRYDGYARNVFSSD